MNMDPNDFYEEDEPVEEVLAAFDRGHKGVTAEPVRGFNEFVCLPGFIQSTTRSTDQTRAGGVAAASGH